MSDRDLAKAWLDAHMRYMPSDLEDLCAFLEEVKQAQTRQQQGLDPLHVALSKILYPHAHKHPSTDTATMLLDVERLKECHHCDAPTHVRVCLEHLDRALVAIGATLKDDERLFAAGDDGQSVCARRVPDSEVPG